MDDVLVLFAVLAAGLVIATPALTVYLLVRERKLRQQLTQIEDLQSGQNDVLHRELAELKRQLATLTRATEATPAPSAGSGTQSVAAAPTIEEAVAARSIEKPAAPVRQPVQIPLSPVAPVGKPLAAAEAQESRFCLWCGTVHSGGTENCPTKALPIEARPIGQTTISEAKPEGEPAVIRETAGVIPGKPADVARPIGPSRAGRPATPVPPQPSPSARVAASPELSSFGAPPTETSARRNWKSIFALEDTLGRNWLNKIGITFVVLGVASFGIYEIGQTGPPGKVAASYLVSLALLAGGIFLERRDRYRVLGHTLIGGGWALLFFTTYALNHVEAMRVMSSETTDLILMLAVALGMVAHTLRYRSQLVTGLSFLLAYSTVALSHDNVYSLSAGVILAIGLVSIVLKMGWFELEVFGILSSYLNHLYWLYRLLGPEGAHGHAFPEYHASTGLLFFYWGVYRISYVVRKVRSSADENVSTAAALLNTLLLLATMKFQSVRPELAFYALLVIGAVEFVLGQLPITKRRRQAFIVLSVLGTALMMAAVPFRYSGNNVAILWLIGGEVLLIAGVAVGEVVFQRLGLLSGFLVGGHLVIIDFAQLMTARRANDEIVISAGIMFALCAAVFYLNALFVARRWRVFGDWPDTGLIATHSYIGAFAAVAAAWAFCSGGWLAVAWIAVAILLALVMQWVPDRHLAWQANAVAACAVVRTFAFNYALKQKVWQGISLRLVTVAMVAAGLYFLSRKAIVRGSEFARAITYLHTFAGTTLLALLAWYEAPSGWVVAVWAVFALVLAILDRRFQLEEFAWQAHALAALTLVRSVGVNLQLTDTWHGISVRLLSLSIVAVVFYALSRVIRMPDEWRTREIQHAYSWAASALVALLMWYELQPLSIAIGWAVFGLALFEYGLLRNTRQFRFQSYVTLTAAFIRLFFSNLTAGVPGEFWGPRIYTILPVTLVLFFVYSQLGPAEKTADDDRRLRFEALLAYLGTASVIALLYFQIANDWLVTAWAIVAFILFGLALWLNRLIFSHQALLVTLAACTRGVMYNLFGASYFSGGTWSGRYLVLGSGIAILFGCLPFAFRLRERIRSEGYPRTWVRAVVQHPEQFMFFAPVLLLTFMLALKMRAGMVTVAWGIEGVMIVLLALAVNERSFRLTGLSLLLLCVGKVLAMDAWGLAPRDRYITFVILGAALILVNFLYIKYSDAIRKFL